MFRFPITVAAGSLGQAAEEAYGIKVKAKHTVMRDFLRFTSLIALG